MILEANSTQECDILKSKVQTRIKVINFAFAIILTVGLSLRSLIPKVKLEYYPINYILTIVTLCFYFVYTYFFVKFLIAATKVIPQYQKNLRDRILSYLLFISVSFF
jgi:hypothetical protein